jgi:HK97 family phage portal protein
MSHLEIIRPARPTRWQRMTTALRSITLGPYNTKDKALAGMFGGSRVAAGVAVNEHTAMNYSAVWAAVNLIAGDIGKVPLVLYKKTGDGKERYENHALYRLIHDRPNPQMGSMMFRRTLQAHALIWGNGYAEIERDFAGRPVALWPMLPSQVSVKINGGMLQYEVKGSKAPVTLDAADVIHIRGLSDDGINGMSVIGNARESIGLSIAAERMGATFYGNGSTFGGIIKYPVGAAAGASGQLARDENRKALESRHQGVDRAHRLLALYEGAEYQQIGVPPNAAQFLETRQFQIEEVCRWFNLPPHKLKHLARSTFSNIEHQGIEYVVDTLDPWWVIWEEELTMKLVPQLERGIQVIEHVREGLLRGDAAARGDFYSKLFSIGSITPNEIRRRENLNPVQGGDTVYIPLNTVPLDRLGEWIDAQITAKETPKAPPPQPAPKEDPEAEDARKAELADARRKAQEWEDRHDQRASEIASLAESLKVTTTSRDEAQLRVDQLNAKAYGLTIELEQMRFKAESTESALAAAVADLSDTVAQRDAVIADFARSQEEVVTITAALRAAEEYGKTMEANALEGVQMLTQAEQERNAAREEVAKVTEAARTRDTSTAEELSNVIDHFEQSKEREAAITAERDTIATEAEALRADLARARADIATELDRQQSQRAVMLAAMRSLFVDASERLLQREVERARKHQQTPDKLRAWMETFYANHAEVCRNLFRPLVGPWTAIAGGAPGVLLERLVTEHIETSTRALSAVLDADDPDQMAGMLERTLRRWEDERAEVMADTLVREGMERHG